MLSIKEVMRLFDLAEPEARDFLIKVERTNEELAKKLKEEGK